MDTIKITTTQNVELEYEPAGVGYRILAALLDGIFVIIYVIAVVWLCFDAFKVFTYENNYTRITIFIVALLPAILYHFLSETFMNGQSFGKKIVGIKVVKLDGSQPGIGSYLVRSLLRIIDIQLLNGLIALIAIVASEKSQRLGDMAAGTTVVRLGQKVSLRETILYKTQSDYNIVFQQVSLLSDKDVGIIKEILDHSLKTNKKENLALLAQKVKTKMGIESALSDEVFLKTVLLDYSHYQFER